MAGPLRLLRLPARLAPIHVRIPLRRDLRGAQQRQDPLGLPRQDPALTEDQLGLIVVLDDVVGQEPSKCASGMRRPSSRSSKCARTRLLLRSRFATWCSHTPTGRSTR